MSALSISEEIKRGIAKRGKEQAIWPCRVHAASVPIAKKRMMKKMNKVTAAVLAAAMVGSMAVPAMALTKSDTSGETKLTYTREEGYTWTIPATVTIAVDSKTGTATDAITVSDNVIATGKALKIKVSSSNNFTLTNKTNSGETRTYEVYKKSAASENKVDAGGVLLEVKAGVAAGKETLVVKLADRTVNTSSDLTGEYDGTLTYTAVVEDPTTTG